MPDSISREKVVLFISALDDLHCCSAAHSEYEILRTAGLLRLLLVDDQPLVDQINREFRMALWFEMGPNYGTEKQPRLPPFTPTFAAVMDGFDPSYPSNHKPEVVDKQRLLKTVVAVVDAYLVTVRMMIKHMAHVDGVMHAGPPKSATDEALLRVRRLMQVGGSQGGVLTLRGVGRVVHKGLMPLRDAVMSRHQLRQ